MTTQNIIRAWKDPYYRDTLSAEQRALMPEHPAGLLELSDTELSEAAGGINWTTVIKTVTETITTIISSFMEGTKYSCCQISCGGTANCTKNDPSCTKVGR